MGVLEDAPTGPDMILMPGGRAGRQIKGLASFPPTRCTPRRLQMATAPAAGVAFSVTASPSLTIALGTDQGIDLLPQGETSWQTAMLKAAGPAGGFGYVGMTTDDQGIALPADPSAGTVWFTFDGGQSWKPSRLNRP